MEGNYLIELTSSLLVFSFREREKNEEEEKNSKGMAELLMNNKWNGAC